MAVAGIIDSAHGLGLVSPRLMSEGSKALKAMLPVQDWPEAVIVCDTLAVGLALQIPGVNTIGIAAESGVHSRLVDVRVPCVIGLPDLLKLVQNEDIIIVDGGRGLVHIDPDLQTVIQYQQMQERCVARNVIYVSAEHLPAKTAGGETVTVYGIVTSKQKLEESIEQGADGVMVMSDCWEVQSYEDLAEIMQTAAGKKILFALTDVVPEILRAAMHYAVPGQVGIVFPLAIYDQAVSHMESAMELAIAEALLEDLSPPRIATGLYVTPWENLSSQPIRSPEIVLVDARHLARLEDGKALSDCISSWVKQYPFQHDMVVLLGEDLHMLHVIFEAGARSVAVESSLVVTAKQAVRQIGIDSDIAE
ncbi:MAG: hypothetical protein ACUVT8_06875 [Armatimonadota bacterium]